ncbi:MAG: hypothetical protein GX096_04800 [Clostridiales bacterium]|nr:hypothetical protein [Clostridiales bacterium]
MTDHELFDRMQQESIPLPNGFNERHDHLLDCLTGQERKTNMKKIIVIALAATLLLGSIAYAATHIDLGKLIFGNNDATVQQTSYVNTETQYAKITKVTTGNGSRGDYQSSTLSPLSLQEAYITDITAFVDGTRLVIGFAKSDVGEKVNFSCDGFFANDAPLAGGLLESDEVFSLDAQMPPELIGQTLTVTLPLHLHEQGQSTGYQYVTFTMAGSEVQSTATLTAKLSDQLIVTLLQGSLSPLGLRIPMQIEKGALVSWLSDYQCLVDGVQVNDAWQGGTDMATDVLLLSVDELPTSLSIRVSWQETQQQSVYDCTGEAVFDLQTAQVSIPIIQREFGYTLPQAASQETNDSEVIVYDELATPQTYMLKPVTLTEEELFALAKDIIPESVFETAYRYGGNSTGALFYTDASMTEFVAGASYEATSQIFTLTGSGNVSDNLLGDVDAPNCTMTKTDAWNTTITFMERFGYTADDLRLERVEAFVADGRGGYFLYLNVLDGGTPRFVSRQAGAVTQWRLIMNEQGIFDVNGRLCIMTDATPLASPIALAQAQSHMEKAVANGELSGIPLAYEIQAIRAVSIASDEWWNADSQLIPAWEFDLVEPQDDWIYQICVNRITGEVFNPNDQKPVAIFMAP